MDETGRRLADVLIRLAGPRATGVPEAPLPAAERKSLKQYVHDISLREQQRRSFVRYAAAFGEQHAAEFDEAFPDEAPPAHHHEWGADAA